MATFEERRRRQRRRAKLSDPDPRIALPPSQQPLTTGAPATDSIAIQAPHLQEIDVKRPSLGAQFRYRFDNVMARGTAAIIGLLGLVTLVFVLVVAAILEIFRILPAGDTPHQYPF